MRNRTFFPVTLSVLLCIALTACAGEEQTVQANPPPDPIQTQVEPVQTAELMPAPVSVPFCYPKEEGTKELFYDSHWKFYIQEHEPDPGFDNQFGAASLICHDLTTGEEWALDELGYGSQHAYWDTLRLYPFTDILGCDGFVFEHGVGSAWHAIDFYEVNDSGTILIAECDNAVYIADLDGNGQPELMSNYHNMGYLDLYWTEDNGTICSCSLNETARDYLGLSPSTWVSLNIQNETSAVEARWTASNGADDETCLLDIVFLWKWEKSRTVFWDAWNFRTEDDRLFSVCLRETRSRPKDPAYRDYYRVEEVQVYDGETLVQTISPEELAYDGDYLFEGLFALKRGRVPGEPDRQDVNFDGFEDLGLMAVETFSQNVPYCYFLWDPEAERFSTDFFVLFAPLEVDRENEQLIESVSNGGDDRYYQMDETGHPVPADSAA